MEIGSVGNSLQQPCGAEIGSGEVDEDISIGIGAKSRTPEGSVNIGSTNLHFVKVLCNAGTGSFRCSSHGIFHYSTWRSSYAFI